MALQPITNIDGLDSAYEDTEMINDAPIGVTLVKFYLKSEDMPKLSEDAGRVIRKNFVWIEKIVNMGNLIIQRRCKDTVAYDETSGKWKVNKLASGMESDIRAYPDAWNAFSRGMSSDIIGTPLEFLFKNDPSKVAAYKAKHIHSIEQLKALTFSHVQELGIGGQQDVDMANYYLSKIQEQAPAIELNNKFEEKDREISNLKKQLAQNMEMMERVLASQTGESVKVKGKPGRKPNKIIKTEEEGIEENGI